MNQYQSSQTPQKKGGGIIKTWSFRSWESEEIEAATDALAERTPEETVLMQEEMNLKEFRVNPFALLLPFVCCCFI